MSDRIEAILKRLDQDVLKTMLDEPASAEEVMTLAHGLLHRVLLSMLRQHGLSIADIEAVTQQMMVDLVKLPGRKSRKRSVQ